MLDLSVCVSNTAGDHILDLISSTGVVRRLAFDQFFCVGVAGGLFSDLSVFAAHPESTFLLSAGCFQVIRRLARPACSSTSQRPPAMSVATKGCREVRRQSNATRPAHHDGRRVSCRALSRTSRQRLRKTNSMQVVRVLPFALEVALLASFGKTSGYDRVVRRALRLPVSVHSGAIVGRLALTFTESCCCCGRSLANLANRARLRSNSQTIGQIRAGFAQSRFQLCRIWSSEHLWLIFSLA